MVPNPTTIPNLLHDFFGTHEERLGRLRFVVLDDLAPKIPESAWTQLSTHAYEAPPPRVAAATVLDAPVDVTLVGRKGAHHVTAARRVALIDSAAPRLASRVSIEIPPSETW